MGLTSLDVAPVTPSLYSKIWDAGNLAQKARAQVLHGPQCGRKKCEEAD